MDISLKKISYLYLSTKPIYRFFINGLLLFTAWFLFYYLIRYSEFINIIYESLTFRLTKFLLYSTKFVLDFLGFEGVVMGKTVKISGATGILLDRGCLGRNLMGLYAGIILAYPGRIISKTWYIPMGIILIIIINILRITSLVIIMKYYPQYVDINHEVIFHYTVYILTFLLWLIWINKFSNKKLGKKEN
jgi:exosortase/archaeosortase family protein